MMIVRPMIVRLMMVVRLSGHPLIQDPLSPDGRKFLDRLIQAGPFKEKVKTAGDGIKLSSKEVVEEHNEHNLEGKNSIEATMETPRTGGSKQIQ